MRYLILLPIILLFALLLALNNAAQARWSVWLYQAETGRILRVDNNGTVISSIDIAAPSPRRLIIAPEGNLAALMRDEQTISLLNLNNGQVLAQIGLSEIGIPHNADDKLILGDVAFSQDSQTLIYSEVLGGLGWQIHVYEIASQSIIATLRSNSEIVANFPALHAGILPNILNIYGDRLSFNADIRQPVGVRTYHWFYQGGILSETVAAPRLNAQSFPYGDEIVLPLWDSRFAADNEDFRYDYQQRNSLHAYDFESGRFPIFVSSAFDIERVWFIEAGRKLLAEVYESEIHRWWIVLGRDGAELRRLPVAGNHVTASPDGFLYTTRVGEQTAVVQVDTRNLANAGTTLWVQPENWQILWAGSNQPEAALSAFVPLGAALQDPSGVPSLLATPTLAPPYFPFRSVGMAIQIFVPDEGYLNLRDAPSTTGGVVTLIESGSRGEIVGGPVLADDFIWWEITIGTRRGWVVERLPEFLALIPPQDLPTPVPTNTATPSR